MDKIVSKLLKEALRLDSDVVLSFGSDIGELTVVAGKVVSVSATFVVLSGALDDELSVASYTTAIKGTLIETLSVKTSQVTYDRAEGEVA